MVTCSFAQKKQRKGNPKTNENGHLKEAGTGWKGRENGNKAVGMMVYCTAWTLRTVVMLHILKKNSNKDQLLCWKRKRGIPQY